MYGVISAFRSWWIDEWRWGLGCRRHFRTIEG